MSWRIRLSQWVARALWAEASAPVLELRPFGADAPFATLAIRYPQFAIDGCGRLIPGMPLTAADCRRAGEAFYDMANWLERNRPMEEYRA